MHIYIYTADSVMANSVVTHLCAAHIPFMGERTGADCDSDMNIMSLVFSVNLASNLLADEFFFLAPSLKDVGCVNPQILRVMR